MKSHKNFDFLVFIGRFQPFHQGHLAVIKTAFEQADQLLILCGSAHQPRSVRNPWTVDEREQMIRATLSAEENQRLHFAPLMDSLYNDAVWVRNVQATVNGLVTAYHGRPLKQARIGLVGHNKDQSSYYLNLFPLWGAYPVNNYHGISATDIREALFGLEDGAPDGLQYLQSPQAEQYLPDAVRHWLADFCQTEMFAEVQAEQRFVNQYKSAWADAPYPPIFVTVDAVVVQSGHVLMVERKARPGKGLLALPGGFLGQDEKLVDGCIRELREETKLKVPAPVLKGSIKRQQVFDDPHRSARGRTITHSFYIELEPDKVLPKVKGSDDARHAMWVPLAELDPNRIFEDHYFIIQEFAGM